MIYNPYPTYTPTGYTAQPQMQQPGPAYAAPPLQTQTGIIWVDGEVGAKAHQLPAGWPVNNPLPLWDANDTLIYLKSTNQMGMPNPLQRLRYTMEDPMQSQPDRRSATPALMSGDPIEEERKYVTHDDLERMKNELQAAIAEAMTNAQTPTASKGGKKNEPAV